MHLPKQSIRLQSLDVFRGITISLMLLVNAMSLSPSIHPWLAHSHWNGCTLADWVFPFFLWITGVSLSFSLSKYSQDHQPTRALYWRLLRRGMILFALGVLVSNVGSDGWEAIQVTGVLQRISLAYLATALIVLKLPKKAQWIVTGLLLLGYWAAYVTFPVPEPTDVKGATHQIGTFGIMSAFGMMTTIAIVLMGYFTGAWLRAESGIGKCRNSSQSMTLVLWGIGSIALGKLWSLSLPINKKLWTSSYALFTVGLALLFLAICYELIEVRGNRRWSYPAQILGLNSIFVFATSELAIKLLENTRIGNTINSPSSYVWLSQHLFGKSIGAATAGFLLALGMLLIWWFIAYCFYQRRWKITL